MQGDRCFTSAMHLLIRKCAQRNIRIGNAQTCAGVCACHPMAACCIYACTCMRHKGESSALLAAPHCDPNPWTQVLLYIEMAKYRYTTRVLKSQPDVVFDSQVLGYHSWQHVGHDPERWAQSLFGGKVVAQAYHECVQRGNSRLDTRIARPPGRHLCPQDVRALAAWVKLMKKCILRKSFELAVRRG